MVDAISHVTIGVANLQPVFDLWIERLGLETVVRREGPDPGLAALWGIPAERIADQILIRIGCHRNCLRNGHRPE